MQPEQIKALRKMTMSQRFEAGLRFIEQMRELRAVMLRVEHPEWTPEEMNRALRLFVLNARS